LKVRWTRLALADFSSAQRYIAAENPQAAMEIARRIRASVLKLEQFPYIGRPGDDLKTREWRVH
jgi:toxin ParE1/3/4